MAAARQPARRREASWEDAATAADCGYIEACNRHSGTLTDPLTPTHPSNHKNTAQRMPQAAARGFSHPPLPYSPYSIWGKLYSNAIKMFGPQYIRNSFGAVGPRISTWRVSVRLWAVCGAERCAVGFRAWWWGCIRCCAAENADTAAAAAHSAAEQTRTPTGGQSGKQAALPAFTAFCTCHTLCTQCFDCYCELSVCGDCEFVWKVYVSVTAVCVCVCVCVWFPWVGKGEEEKKTTALDEGDIKLLKSYGQGPYTASIKKLEKVRL